MNDTMDTTSIGKTTTLVPPDPPPQQQHVNGGDAPVSRRTGNLTKTALDPLIYRLVVAFLGLTMLLTIAGVIVLLAIGKNTVPEGLIALGAATIGALVGFLTPSPVGARS